MALRIVSRSLRLPPEAQLSMTSRAGAGEARPSTPGSPARGDSRRCPGGREGRPLPERERIHVEVLAIEMDALLAEHAIHMIGEPPLRRFVPGSEAYRPRSHSGCFSPATSPGPRVRARTRERLHALAGAWSLIARSPAGTARGQAPTCLSWATGPRRDTSRRPSTSKSMGTRSSR